MKLEEKFNALVIHLQNFFKEDSASSHDFVTINQLRDLGLDLAEEAQRSHRLGVLTAFALSNQTIETEYALHPLQLVCLVLYGTRGYALDPDQRRELTTAALFCDLGFRLAWPFHSDHGTTVMRALGEHRFPWWSLKIENLVVNHHQPEKDPSPHQILSLAARFLELVRGTGVEQSKTDLLSPAKAMQAINDDPLFRLESRHSFYQHLGHFPVGSWVSLTTGRKGLVLAIRPQSPQQPLLAVPMSDAPGSTRFALLDAQKSSVSISNTAPPYPMIDSLFSDPHQWLPGWDGELAKLETTTAEFQIAMMVDGLTASPETPAPAPVSPSVAPSVFRLETPPEAARPFPAPGIKPVPVEPEPTVSPAFIYEIQQAVGGLEDRLHQAYQATAERMERLLHQLSELQADLAHLAPLYPELEERQGFETFRQQIARQQQLAEKFATDFKQRWTVTTGAWQAKTAPFLSQLEELKSGKQRGPFRALEQRWHDELRNDLQAFAAKWRTETDALAQRVKEPVVKVQQYRQKLVHLPSLLAEKSAYTLLMQGVDQQKHGHAVDAQATLEKAIAQRPFFWEAKAFLQLCVFENTLSKNNPL